MEDFLKKHHKIIVALIMTFFISVSLLNAKNDSATFDEVAHIPAGYSYVTQHDMRLNPEHPPLLKDLVGIPLAFLDLNFDTSQKFWTGDYPRLWDDGQWSAGKHLLYEAGNNPDQILFWARLPIIIISVILGLFLFMWGKEIAGILGGLFILTIYAFDPNILGHNHYVTTDIGIAAFLTFAFYYFLKFIKNPSWKNVALGGFFLGLVNLTKFSSIMAYPILGLTLLIYPLIKKVSHDKAAIKKSLRLKIFFEYFSKGIAAMALSLFVVWVGYAVNTYKMPKEVIDKQINFSFPTNDYNPLSIRTNQALTSLNSAQLTRPFAEYTLGVAMVFKRVAGGNGAYFLGNVTSEASKIYFPFVFVAKETIPMLSLMLLAIGLSLTEAAKSIKQSIKDKNAKKVFAAFLQKRVTRYVAASFIVLYAFLSITGNLNIGFRHLFPILPFIYILITKKVFDLFKGKHYFTQQSLKWGFTILIAWIVIIPVLSYPNYTSYFNESVGGSKNGYKYVTDSNTDWGQDLKRLKSFLDEHPEIDKIRTDYFGGGNPEYYLGEKFTPWWDARRPVEAGWYAISVNSLQTSIYDKANKNYANNYAWTKAYEPTAMIGSSIMIFNIETPPVE